MKRRSATRQAAGFWAAALALAVIMVGREARGAAQVWNVPSGVWSDGANWNPGPAPGLSDTMIFDAAGADGINTNDLAALKVASFVASNYTHTTDMNANSFTATTFAAHGIGLVTARWNAVSSGDLHVLTELRVAAGAPGSGLVGPRVGATVTNGLAHVVLAADVGLQVGTPSTYATYLMVGYQSAYSPTILASLTAGAVFNGYVNNLFIGRRTSGSGGPPYLYGMMDLSNVTEPGVLYVKDNLSIGGVSSRGELLVSDAMALRVGTSTSARGLLLLNNMQGAGDISGVGGIRLGTNRFEVYTTTLNIGNTAGFSYLDASKVKEGVIDASGDVVIGKQPAASWAPHTDIRLSNGMRVKFGDPAARVVFEFGFTPQSTTTNLFVMGTNRFEAYLNRFDMAVDSSGNSYTTPRSFVTLDLGSVSNGTFQVTNSFRLGYHSTIVSELRLSDAFTTTIGTPTVPASMIVGDGNRWVSNTFTAGGTFHAYLSTLVVGRCGLAAPVVNQTLVDLSRVTDGTLDVSGEMLVGVGAQSARGTLTLPAGMSAEAAYLTVGTNTTLSRGWLNLNGTRFVVETAAVLDGPSADDKGRIHVTVAGAPAGLDLADAATLTVNQGLIHVDFQPATEHAAVYWGLRWEGSHAAELTALAGTAKLTWDASAIAPAEVSVFEEGGYTYLGAKLVKPQGTLILML